MIVDIIVGLIGIVAICLYVRELKKSTKLKSEHLISELKLIADCRNYKKLLDKLKTTYNQFVADAKKQMDTLIVVLKKKYDRDVLDKVQKVIKDYDEALKLEILGLLQKVVELDLELGNKLRLISNKNTMYFTCACDRGKPIPCSIDLGEELNYFTCPECGAVYRVVVNTSTILMSGITNNPKIASMYDGVNILDIGDRTPL